MVRHPGGVGILALDDEDCAVLVEQYRYVFGRTLLEIPAGKREPGEDPLTTARRELREETGAEATHWQPLGAVLPSPGCYGEVLHLYLARDLTFGATHPMPTNFAGAAPPLRYAAGTVPLRRDRGRQDRGRRAEGEAAGTVSTTGKEQSKDPVSTRIPGLCPLPFRAERGVKKSKRKEKEDSKGRASVGKQRCGEITVAGIRQQHHDGLALAAGPLG